MIYDIEADPEKMHGIQNPFDAQLAIIERLDKIIELLEPSNNNEILSPTPLRQPW